MNLGTLERFLLKAKLMGKTGLELGENFGRGLGGLEKGATAGEELLAAKGGFATQPNRAQRAYNSGEGIREFAKEHPYATTGAGLATAGGLGALAMSDDDDDDSEAAEIAEQVEEYLKNLKRRF